MARESLSRANEQILIELYTRTHKTADDLPYSEEFETPYTGFIARSGLTLTRHDVWRALTNCRKAGKLVRKER